jgi:hypothetical protein
MQNVRHLNVLILTNSLESPRTAWKSPIGAAHCQENKFYVVWYGTRDLW